MTAIIEQIEQHVRDMKAMSKANDLDGFYMCLKELTNYVFEAEVPNEQDYD